MRQQLAHLVICCLLVGACRSGPPATTDRSAPTPLAIKAVADPGGMPLLRWDFSSPRRLLYDFRLESLRCFDPRGREVAPPGDDRDISRPWPGGTHYVECDGSGDGRRVEDYQGVIYYHQIPPNSRIPGDNLQTLPENLALRCYFPLPPEPIQTAVSQRVSERHCYRGAILGADVFLNERFEVPGYYRVEGQLCARVEYESEVSLPRSGSQPLEVLTATAYFDLAGRHFIAGQSRHVLRSHPSPEIAEIVVERSYRLSGIEDGRGRRFTDLQTTAGEDEER
ncbi:MAG: hypothetical protein HY319_07530 [Armatimonadetes bacterium]|nr:hypothetical protein [Armatimonadota bacterium]